MSKYLGIVYVLIGLVIVALAASTTTGYTRRLVLNEDGLIEVISAIGYFFCALIMARRGGTVFVNRYIYAFIVVLLLGSREMDFQNRFLFAGIFSSRFYVNPDSPVLLKLAGIVIIFLTVYAVYKLVMHLTGPLLRGLLTLNRCAVATTTALGLLGAAMLSDGIERKLAWFNIQIAEQTVQLVWVFEEVVEMGIPIMLCLALYYYFEDGEVSEPSPQ